ncbi:MAG TPA: glycosyltransferase family A protein [Aeromicrobium sp.]|nr:glycosyltransferase family A protein [Aeromicrobium sp.]
MALLQDLALRLDKSSLTIADECLRFRFEESADLVALVASDGELAFDEVLAIVRAVLAGETSPEQAAEVLDPYALSSLMRLIAGLHASGQLMAAEFGDAADLGRVARMIRGDVRFSATAARIEGQVNLAAGQFDHVAAMLADGELNDDTRWMLSTELAHPANGAPGASHDEWLRLFNRRFEEFGLLPITVADGQGAAFDRVTVDVPESRMIDDGPLVTVIMSTYRPDQSFPTAVRSLLQQTWRNLEILVIDDCSPPDYDAILAEVTGLDPRIQFVRMPVNGGTYRIRNEGIRRSRGAFIAFQDSDDWAHPERIARQMAPLLDDDAVVATHCRCVRVFPDLVTLNVGMNSFRRCAPSTVFRKDVVIDALGGYDETRKEADNEFYERIQVVFGEDANVDLRDVLVLYQLTHGSLSRDEYRFAWQHGARAAYIQARRYWHRQIAAGRESPRLEPGGDRRIHAPSRVLTGRDAEPAGCDVLWISDWRAGLPRYDGQIGLVEATTSAGYSTLAAQATAVRHASRARVELRDDILALQADGTTRLVVWTEQTHARLAIVTDPELLNLTRQPEQVAIRADRLVVAAPHPPEAPDGRWLTYGPVAVEANARRMFATSVEWLPASAAIADELRRLGAQNVLQPAHLIVGPDAVERPYRGARGAGSLVVGTCGLDPRRRDRPNIKALEARLPTSDAYDVRILDARMCARQQESPRAMPLSWVAVDGLSDDARFQRQLDVFATIPTRTWGPFIPWTVVTALVEGAVVLADPDMEPLLGEAAIYARAGEADAALSALTADPSRLDDQRARGYAFCRDRASSRALIELIGTLLTGREDQG